MVGENAKILQNQGIGWGGALQAAKINAKRELNLMILGAEFLA